MSGIPPRGESKPHSEACRRRIEEAIKNDEEQRDRWLRNEERINERIYRRMEEMEAENNKRARGEDRQGEQGEQAEKGEQGDRRKREAEQTEEDEEYKLRPFY